MSKFVNIVNNDNFERFLLLTVKLFCTRDFFYQFLKNNSIIIFCILRTNIQMISTRQNWNCHFCSRIRIYSVLLDLRFYWVNPWPVHLLEKTHNSSFFTSTWWPVEEHMRKINGISKFREFTREFCMIVKVFEFLWSIFVNPEFFHWEVCVGFCYYI